MPKETTSRNKPQISRIVECVVRGRVGLLLPDSDPRPVEIHGDSRAAAPHRREGLQPSLGVVPVAGPCVKLYRFFRLYFTEEQEGHTLGHTVYF